MTPTVSVICLCYNHERYVTKAIESILRQSMGDFELIVVDDGSTDGSADLIGSIADSRLRLIQQDNRGPSYASSRAVAQVRGRYIALMSADDLCAPHRLEAQLHEMEQRSLDVHFSRPLLIDEDDKPLPDSSWPVFFERTISSREELYRTLFFEGNFLCATSAMLRREVVDAHGWVHNGLLQLQDFLLWIRLVPHCDFGMSEERLLMYRVRGGGGNLSSKRNSGRTIPEKSVIYRRFFDGAPRPFVLRAFSELNCVRADLAEDALQAHLSLLYLQHRNRNIKMIGIERLIELLERIGDYDALREATGIDVREVYRRFDEAFPDLAGKPPKSSQSPRKPIRRLWSVLRNSF